MTTTLLITTYNRGRLLHNNLQRLSRLTIPDEVLVIDDGGTDSWTEKVCLRMADKLPMRYLYHDNPGRTLCSEARNIGIKYAKGNNIITCEPEMVFETDVVAQMLADHERLPDSVISAGTIRHEQLDGSIKTEKGWVATFVAFYVKQWLIDIGGWDEQFPGTWGHDDTDVVTRLRLTGHQQFIDPDIIAQHQYHPPGEDNLEQGTLNERYVAAKAHNQGNRHGPARTDRRDLVANKGEPWGVLRTKNS